MDGLTWNSPDAYDEIVINGTAHGENTYLREDGEVVNIRQTLATAGIVTPSEQEIARIQSLVQIVLGNEEALVVEVVATVTNIFDVSIMEACEAIEDEYLHSPLTMADIRAVANSAEPIYAAKGLSSTRLIADAGELADRGVPTPEIWRRLVNVLMQEDGE